MNKLNTMNLRKRKNTAPVANQPKRQNPVFVSNVPVRKAGDQQKLNKGRRMQGKMVNEWMRKRFPRRVVKYMVRPFKKDEWYKQAILHHKKRVAETGNSFAAPLSEEQLDQMIKVVRGQMQEIAGALKCNRGNSEAGRKWMEHTSKNTHPTEITKAIEMIEKLDPFDTLSDPESKQTEFEVNNKCLVSIDTNKFHSMSHLSDDFFFNFIERNNIDMKSFQPGFRSGFRSLRKYQEKFRCKCTGGDCNQSCPCFITNGLLTANVNDPTHRRRYTCSEKCGCQGSCSKSFPAPPPNNVKVVLDNEMKGCATYSTQYAGPSETILEMRGVIRDEDQVDPQDEYAYQIYEVENDIDVINQVFERNRKLRAHQKVEALSVNYEKTLEKLTNTNICLDPRIKSNEARYMSHSCFPNCRATMVYSEGLNPAKIRVMMTSLLPIYPGQELTFFYSLEYACQQLSDKCLCKHLCCVRNVELFPFITKKHIKKYYTKLYKKLHEDYLNKVAGKP